MHCIRAVCFLAVCAFALTAGVKPAAGAAAAGTTLGLDVGWLAEMLRAAAGTTFGLDVGWLAELLRAVLPPISCGTIAAPVGPPPEFLQTLRIAFFMMRSLSGSTCGFGGRMSWLSSAGTEGFSMLRVLRGGAVTERSDLSGEGDGDAEFFERGA